MTRYKKLWFGLLALVILCPLGLIATGTAFGEWGSDEVKQMLGFVPKGLEKFSDIWSHAPMPDYSIPMLSSGTAGSVAGYIISAMIGIAFVVAISMLIGRVVKE